MLVENGTVTGGHDGFDIRSCANVVIQNCYFNTGDDCIAGFDNHDITVRNCLFSSSCFLLRFGDNHVRVEHCKSLDGACFMYYCDFRAEIRKPVEDILIRDCVFGDLMTILSQNWDENYRWCCNQPLKQIKFENCVFKSIYGSIYIHTSEDVPMTFEMENCDITVKPGYEHIAFLDGNHFGTVRLKNVRLHGYANPRIVKHTEGVVEMEDCSEIEIVLVNDAESRGPYMDQLLMTDTGLKMLEPVDTRKQQR